MESLAIEKAEVGVDASPGLVGSLRWLVSIHATRQAMAKSLPPVAELVSCLYRVPIGGRTSDHRLRETIAEP